MAVRSLLGRASLLIGLALLFIGAGVVAGVDYRSDQKESGTPSVVGDREGGWIPFIKGSTPEKPRVTVLWSTPSEIRLRIEVYGMWYQEVEQENQIFTKIGLPGYSIVHETGKPAIPVIREMLQIPYGAEPDIEVVRVREEEFSLKALGINNWITPVQPSVATDEPKLDLVIDENFYQTDDYYPGKLAKVVKSGTVRGCRFILVRIAPVMYAPGEEKIKVCSEIEVEIRLSGSDMATTRQMLDRYASPSYEALFKSLFLNYQAGGKGPEPTPSSLDPEGYLIITPPSFEDALAPLVEWKHKKGFDVTVATTDSIGDDTTDIRAYIEDAYDNWDIPPTYVLLVGDTDFIPTYYRDTPDWGGTDRSAVDLCYVTMTDSSYFPDIKLGRIPAQDSTEVGYTRDKILSYEKVLFDSLEWMNRFFLIMSPRVNEPKGYSDKGAYLGRDTLVSLQCIDDDMICDTVRVPYYCYPYLSSDVSAALNEGRALVTYTDHGYPHQWNCPHFAQDEVRALSNTDKYPFVLSLCCQTGSFNENECFGEIWFREEDEGAIAFWGASFGALFDYMDVMENGIYTALCEDSLYTVSGATDRGLYYLYQHYGGGDRVEGMYQGFNILGDPSIDLWMDVCDSLSVNYDPCIGVGRQTFTVEVEAEGSPISEALICLLKDDDVFKVVCTGVAGTANLRINPAEPGTLFVTVTKHNCKPHEGSTFVSYLICGDVNNDSLVDSLDVDYLEDCLYCSGPAPQPECLGDVNCNGIVDVGDLVYLINYVFQEGDAPCDTCCD